MSPFLTDEVSPELSPSPSPSQGNTAPRINYSTCFICQFVDVPKDKSRSSVGAIVGGVCGVIFLIVVIIVAVICCKRKSSPRAVRLNPSTGPPTQHTTTSNTQQNFLPSTGHYPQQGYVPFGNKQPQPGYHPPTSYSGAYPAPPPYSDVNPTGYVPPPVSQPYPYYSSMENTGKTLYLILDHVACTFTIF